jgi:hypothetical protein
MNFIQHFIEYPSLKADGKGPLGRPIHGWVDNIELDLGEIGWCGMD